MQKQRHIFEIKEEMNARGWSCITPVDYQELDYFTQQWIADRVGEGFDHIAHDVVLGNGEMFYTNEEAEF